MRHVRMLGLCLLAALAVGAYAVSSASALPEFGKCEAKAGGKYKDANCTEKAKKGTGAYEWVKGSKLKPRWFEGNNVGTGGVLTMLPRVCKGSNNEYYGTVTRAACAEKGAEQYIGGEVTKVECESEHSRGEITGSKSIANIQVEFKGCKLFGSVPCSNGPEEGEVDVNVLKGSLGYINKSEHKVGVLLEPAAKHGEFAQFNCGGAFEIIVAVGNDKEGAEYTSSGCSGVCAGTTPSQEKDGGYDGIISPITPVNVMASHFTQEYTVNPTTSENIPSSFEHKHIDLLEGHLYATSSVDSGIEWSKAGEEITNENVDCEENDDTVCSSKPGLGEIKG